jgi:chemotaxis signal transduction protein
VTEVEGLVMGLAVDAAVDVLPVDVTQLEDPPALATQTGYDVTRAVVRRPDAEPILVLSLEHLLESVYRSALASKEDEA